MTPWDLIKYMYLLSVISMGMYILQNKDSFLISYGMQKKKEKMIISYSV